MRIWISAMLLASTAALGAPALAQDQPHGHDGGGQHGGDHHGGGGGDHGRGPAPGQPQGQPPQARPPQGGQPGAPQPNRAPPPAGRDDPRFRGGGGSFQGDRGPGGDPRQYGHAGGDPVNHPGWNGGPGGNDGHGHDRPINQDGRPGFDNRGDGGRPGGYDNRGPGGFDHGPGGYDHGPGGRPGGYDHGPGGRPGGYDRGPGGDHGSNWNRGWRNDNRYDWQGWRAQHRDIYRGRGYRAPYGVGYGYRRFGIGVSIDAAFFAQQYWISDPYYYHLPPAYGPYRWVRYYNDALLVDIYSGTVVDVIPGFFW